MIKTPKIAQLLIAGHSIVALNNIQHLRLVTTAGLL